MLTDERDNLRPHVVTIDRVHINPVEKTLGRRYARFLVSTRPPPTFEKLRRGRLAKIVRKGGEHHSHLTRVPKFINQVTRPIDYELCMHKDIALRMPLGILWHINQALNLRKEFFDRAQLPQPLNTNRRSLRAQ